MEFLRQRNFVPAEAGLAHVDRNRPVGVLLGVENAAGRLEREAGLAGLRRQRLDDTAGAVAAGLRPRTVGIDDVDVMVGAVEARIVDRHDLVEAGFGGGVERDGGRGRNRIGAAAHVGHDDQVSKPVHFRKRNVERHLSSGFPWLSLLYGGSGLKMPVSAVFGLRLASGPISVPVSPQILNHAQTMTATIDNRTARRAFLALQGLSEPPHKGQTKADLLEAIRQLGFVQVDSINTVARAHHQILFSRNATYREKHLKTLVEKDNLLFEHWTHDASIIPCELFPYWRHRFVREDARLQQRWEGWQRAPFLHECDGVLERIAKDGPVMTRDFEGDKPSTGWWDWHPSKTALEYLWRTGKLAIARRDGFQKVYDLAERVIPGAHHAAEVEHHEFVDWACRSALQRLGFRDARRDRRLLGPVETGRGGGLDRGERGRAGDGVDRKRRRLETARIVTIPELSGCAG